MRKNYNSKMISSNPGNASDANKGNKKINFLYEGTYTHQFANNTGSFIHGQSEREQIKPLDQSQQNPNSAQLKHSQCDAPLGPLQVQLHCIIKKLAEEIQLFNQWSSALSEKQIQDLINVLESCKERESQFKTASKSSSGSTEDQSVAKRKNFQQTTGCSVNGRAKCNALAVDPLLKYVQNEQGSPQQVACTYCNNSMVTLPCSHQYHSECLRKVFNEVNDTCFQCNFKLETKHNKFLQFSSNLNLLDLWNRQHTCHLRAIKEGLLKQSQMRIGVCATLKCDFFCILTEKNRPYWYCPFCDSDTVLENRTKKIKYLP